MSVSTWLRSLRSAVASPRGGHKKRPATFRLRLEALEDRCVPSVTAVNDNFTTLTNTPTTLNVLANDTNPTGGLRILSATPIAPAGPTLTQNADGTFSFTSAAAGTYSFNYSITGQTQEVTASDGSSDQYPMFGGSVAMSGDTAVIGTVQNANKAYVFTRSGTTWTQQAELRPSDGRQDDQFGNSVSISGDTVVVGANFHSVTPNASEGSAYVFTRSGTTWSQQAELTAADSAGNRDQFGYSVSVSGDTVVVGAKDHNSQGAAYLFTRSRTTWTQQQELTAADGVRYSEFGRSVALSGDTVAVGANNNLQGAPSVYVYTRAGTTWSQQQDLVAAEGGNPSFGYSVALDGDTLVAGAPQNTIGNNAKGTAYVFTRSGTTWSQQQALFNTLDGGGDDAFGHSVSLSGDGIVVGSRDHQVGNNAEQGSAYVFMRSGTTWSLQQEFTPADGAAQDRFGWSAALSGDNVLVGAWAKNVGVNPAQGAAYFQNWTQATATVTVQVKSPNVTAADDTFTASTNTPTNLNVLANDTNPTGGLQILSSTAISPTGPTLTQNADGTFSITSAAAGTYTFNYTATGKQQAVMASDGVANDHFGRIVAISGDTAVVGSPLHQVGSNVQEGAAYVFTRSGTTWTQQQELTAADGATTDSFGNTVSISGDTIVVGAYNHPGNGRAYVYTRSGTTWSQQQELTAADGVAGDVFGWSVSVSGDTILVGVYNHKVGSNAQQGSAYVFTRSGTTWSQQQELTAADGVANDFFGASVSVSGDTALVGAYLHQVGNNAAQGSAYVFTRSGTTWTQQQELTAADGAANDAFGNAVALSGDTILVGVPTHQVGTNAAQGAAYVYARSGTTWTQQQELTAADGLANDQFGVSVSVSGETVLVGASSHTVGNNAHQGSAYVFTRSGTTWTRQRELTAADGATNDAFGFSVSISGDTIVAGALLHAGQGAAYFQNWTQATATVTVTVTAPAAAAITATSGGGQSALVTAAFTSPLVATVTDASGQPVPDATVTFASPSSGAGVTFNGGNTATTDQQGRVSKSVTANGSVGSFTVTASVAGVTTSANFALTNTIGPATTVRSTAGSGQSVPENTAFATPLVATVTDDSGNPVPNVTVTFTAPASGAGVTFTGGATAVTNSLGQARRDVTANGSAGTYTVVASIPGATTVAGFTLTNTAVAVANGQLAFSAAAYSFDEKGGTITLTVTRTAGADGAVTVQYDVAAAKTSAAKYQAIAGTDFTGASHGTLAFNAGEVQKNITFAIVQDKLVEENKSFVVTLSGQTGGASLGSQVSTTVTIVDDNLPVVPNATPKLPTLQKAGIGFGTSDEHYQQFVRNAYDHYLRRKPSDAEVKDWVDKMKAYQTDHTVGLKQEQIEAGFIDSKEYIGRFGSVGKSWIDGIYQDLLTRAPDANGETFWLGQLAVGLDPTLVALGFTTSLERLQNRVSATYLTLLERPADKGGLDYWVHVFNTGGTTEDINSGFVGSVEYYGKMNGAAGNPARWVREAYLDVLFRAAKVDELAYCLGFLNS